MASAFSPTGALYKALSWRTGNTRKSVEWAMKRIEEYLKAVEASHPHLASQLDKVTTGEINGDPHPTYYRNGPDDPFHASGAMGVKNLKSKSRMTSFHVYPSGLVKPTNSTWPTLQVTPATVEELGDDAHWLNDEYCKAFEAAGYGDTSEAVAEGSGSLSKKGDAISGSSKHTRGSKGHGSSSSKGKNSDSSGLSNKGKAPDGTQWEWDEAVGSYRRMSSDSQVNIYWDEESGREKYWDGIQWQWR